MTSTFRGKSALVTGAGSGIGAALCTALAAAGADVVCTDIDADAAERTAASLGGRARSARLDVTDPDAVQAAVHDVVERAGRLDLMFNNAGIVWGGDTELLTLEQWNAIIDVNIRGVVHGVRAAYPHMIRQGHGHIVNTASMAGLTAAGQITSYVMTKHAIVGLSLALRSEAAAGQGGDRRLRRAQLLPAGWPFEGRLSGGPLGAGHADGDHAQQGAAGQAAKRARTVVVRAPGAGPHAARLDRLHQESALTSGRRPRGSPLTHHQTV
jgi:NADP-dependent 3-hydroxy acid dehydrogenase YdfG